MPRSVVLVTGGARRIGRVIALDLAAAGWNVAITSKQLISLVDVTVARKGGGPSVLQLDPRGQALAFDEADGSPFPWFVINYSDLWSIYREIPSGV